MCPITYSLTMLARSPSQIVCEVDIVLVHLTSSLYKMTNNIFINLPQMSKDYFRKKQIVRSNMKRGEFDACETA